MKQDWKPGTMIYPLPAVLVSCGNTEEEYNVLTVAWTGTICSNPPMCYISVRPERHSYDIIKRNSGVDDMEMPQVSMLYSKTAVVNSLMDKIAEKCKIQQKNETENSNKVKADSLMSRLNLLKNWR